MQPKPQVVLHDACSDAAWTLIATALPAAAITAVPPYAQTAAARGPGSFPAPIHGWAGDFGTADTLAFLAAMANGSEAHATVCSAATAAAAASHVSVELHVRCTFTASEFRDLLRVGLMSTFPVVSQCARQGCCAPGYVSASAGAHALLAAAAATASVSTAAAAASAAAAAAVRVGDAALGGTPRAEPPLPAVAYRHSPPPMPTPIQQQQQMQQQQQQMQPQQQPWSLHPAAAHAPVPPTLPSPSMPPRMVPGALGLGDVLSEQPLASGPPLGTLLVQSVPPLPPLHIDGINMCEPLAVQCAWAVLGDASYTEDDAQPCELGRQDWSAARMLPSIFDGIAAQMQQQQHQQQQHQQRRHQHHVDVAEDNGAAGSVDAASNDDDASSSGNEGSARASSGSSDASPPPCGADSQAARSRRRRRRRHMSHRK